MAKILITGVSGLVGSGLANFFVAQGHTVTGVCYSNNSRASYNVNLVRVSLVESLNLKAQIDPNQDVVVHCAASHPSITDDPKKLTVDNIKAVINLLHFCRNSDVKKLIFCSSVEVYGDIRSEILQVDEKINNPTLYGLSKLICERLIIDWSRETGNTYHNLRLPAVIGLGSHTTFIIKLIEAFEKKVPVIVNNKKALFNNFVSLIDLGFFVDSLVSKDIDSNTFLLGSAKPVTMSKLIKFLGTFFTDSDINRVINEAVPPKPSFYINSDRAILNGFEPRETLKVLEEYLVARL